MAGEENDENPEAPKRRIVFPIPAGGHSAYAGFL